MPHRYEIEEGLVEPEYIECPECGNTELQYPDCSGDYCPKNGDIHYECAECGWVDEEHIFDYMAHDMKGAWYE